MVISSIDWYKNEYKSDNTFKFSYGKSSSSVFIFLHDTIHCPLYFFEVILVPRLVPILSGTLMLIIKGETISQLKFLP